MPSADIAAAVDRVYRSDWGRIVAALIRLIGDFELAEDAAQEAFAAAVEQWAGSGVPEFPRAWIIQAARNRAIDRIRRQARFTRSSRRLPRRRSSLRRSPRRERRPQPTPRTSRTTACG